MHPPLDGNILITGASSGIGDALARRLAATASTLVLVARRRERLEALAAELRASRSGLEVRVVPCDLSDTSQIRDLVTTLSDLEIDVLINNAGLGDIGLFETIDERKLESMLMVNVVGLSLLTRALVPGMVARRRGGILNISSGFGLLTMPCVAAYAGSKHYVTAFSESLRTELAPMGIVVTQVCPGPVATEFEDVAGNPFGQPVPAAVELTADEAAAAALHALSAQRAIVVPGLLPSVGINLGRLVPYWLSRTFYGLFSRSLRNRLGGPT